MAKKIQHVWGLEIGQSSMKALRCHLEGDTVVADTFDFVEYPKILSQPEAEPEALISDALEQFTSRNDLRGALVAVSVPGQSGLAKFFKPPPVEVKKIGDIVKYEAKQQIPFDLKDVIWDFQQMEGAQIEDGYALESEVGLFAMKREAVFRALKPYRDRNIDIDLVQLAPMSLYNMVTHDRFAERLSSETFDPESPQKSVVILSIGTDASDLIVTNGFRVWQRNIPIGGNHFTRQLTKDLKLTFAKAEHLKRNALQADDPKLVFQAMRPVFNDMVTEIQRSLNFYKTVNKKGEIESMLLLGNTSKLPGLLQFLNKNLGMEVQALDRFPKLEGNEVIGAQAFKENVPAYGVVYGLCLQLLKRGPMKTSLLPRDIVLERVIRNKKPWTVGALSILLGAMVTYHATKGQALSVVDVSSWKDAESKVETLSKTSSSEFSKDSSLTGKAKLYREVGKEVSSGASRRLQTLELLKVVEASLFKNPDELDKTPVELPYNKRKDFHVTSIEQKYFADLEKWFTPDLKTKYLDGVKTRRAWFAPEKVADAIPDPSPLTGPGWVIEIKGYHYYNGIIGEEKQDHVLRYMVEFLENGTIELPMVDKTGISPPAEGKPAIPEGHVLVKDLGIRLPVIRLAQPLNAKHQIANPEYQRLLNEERIKAAAAAGAAGGVGGEGIGSGVGGPGMGGPGMGGPGMGGPGMGGSGLGGPGMGGSGMGGYGAEGGGMTGAAAFKPLKDEKGNEVQPFFDAPKFEFVLQFAWKPRFEPEGGSLAGGVITESTEEGVDGEGSVDASADASTTP
jgi:type IV pilus assembly protein PilM